MDGPNVNWKLHELFQELISEVDENAPILVNVGSCGLHIVHNAFKAGSKASTWSIQEVLSSLHWLFVDSPARREDYTEITSSVVFPIKYCKHRWLENLPVVVRAQEIWKEVTFYVTTVQRSSKYSVPTSKSYKTIRDSTQDPLMPLKFAAFESVAKQLQPFLGASSAVKLLKIDFKKRENCLDVEKLDVGFVAATKLKELQAAKKISDRQTYEFRKEFQSFLTATVGKLIEKTPIAYSLARNLCCLDPIHIVTEKEASCARFKIVLKKLVECKRVDIHDCDILLSQYSEFTERATQVHKSEFEDFDFTDQRLDAFLQKHIGLVGSLSKLWDVVKFLLCLSHGQASVERGFSVNRQLMIENMKETTFVAQRTIHDHILSIDGFHKLVISNEFLPLLKQEDSGITPILKSSDSLRKMLPKATNENLWMKQKLISRRKRRDLKQRSPPYSLMLTN
ncbi:unnamed protein product [Pocillopora meandrina]|uniref:HAT C-terminal dimerisation domain-containing protein n=1 Tax=Pocillopora meandrina TaxID=46732 RepID=A0AAU9WR36_9CNID|nr:unnamed protein product [Pocillopora meandrina]